MPSKDSHNRFVRQTCHFGWALCLAVLCALLAPPWLAVGAAAQKVLVIGDDHGGGVVQRAQAIQRYRQTGTRLEIRGQFCLSACTMYLALDDTCVSPKTVFGFHGPSSPLYGIALSPDSFETASQLMAAHYPEPIRTWFLDRGRHRTVGFHRYYGSDLIQLGINRCTGPTATG